MRRIKRAFEVLKVLAVLAVVLFFIPVGMVAALFLLMGS